MSSSSDLPVGFLAKVFADGCQCDCCKTAKAEIERLKQENALLRSENYTLRQRDGMIVVKREGK